MHDESSTGDLISDGEWTPTETTLFDSSLVEVGVFSDEINPVWFAVQYVRVEKRDGRWAAFPQENFRAVQGGDEWDRIWPNSGVFPAWYYEDGEGDFLIRLKWRTASAVEGGSQDMQGRQTATFWTEPQPDGIFSVSTSYQLSAVYTGEPENKSRYTQIASSGYLVWDRKDGSGQQEAGMFNSGWESRTDDGFETGSGSGGEAWGSSSDGRSWGGRLLKEGWEDEIFLGGGGTNGGRSDLPACYVMELYLNGSPAAKLTLKLVEGGVLDE